MSLLGKIPLVVPILLVAQISLAARLACAAGEADQAARLERYERTEIHMATDFRIVLYAADEPTANGAFSAAFARIKELDDHFNDYRSETELSRLSASSPHAKPVPVSRDMYRILARSQELSHATDGAFDVTVGPLTNLWRRARRQAKLPPQEMLREALAAVGYRHLELDAAQQAVRLTQPRMRLDLGGIAQGFAADEALRVVRQRGIDVALINASGDIVAGEPPPGEIGWLIAIAPLEPKAPPAHFIHLSRAAVSTSGDAFQFVEIDGVRYSHIVDPRTGLGLSERASVSVVARDGATADALATALCVRNGGAALELIAKFPDAAALIVRQQGDAVEVQRTENFARYEVPGK